MMYFFEKIKSALQSLASSRGVPDDELLDDWSLNYRRNADAEFMANALTLSELMRVHRDAIAKGELLTARCALVTAQGIAHNLSSFFYAMKEDMIRAADRGLNRTGNSILDWPPLPQRYEYPPEYGYRDADRVIDFGQEGYRWDVRNKRWTTA